MRTPTLLALALVFLPRPSPGQEPERLRWKGFDPAVSREYFQEITTKVKQAMKVMDTDVNQTQEQTFLFRWVPGGLDKDQNWLATQEFVRVKMLIDIGGSKIDHDTDNPKGGGPLGGFFDALVKTKLRYKLSPRLQVLDLTGHEDLIKRLKDAGGPGVGAMENLFTKDALMTMAEPAFSAVPLDPVKVGSTWKRTIEQKLPGVGRYQHDYTYTYEGKDGDLDKITFVARIDIKPPNEEGGLPFKIRKIDIAEGAARGSALFDRRLGRFTKMEQTGTLQGTLVIDVGGMETTIRLLQTQTTTSRTTPKRP
ncbi:MAG: DUF6263 family protein [Gemmataceae bacterium]